MRARAVTVAASLASDLPGDLACEAKKTSSPMVLIDAARVARGMSKSRLAALAQVSASYYSELLASRHQPSPAVVARLWQALRAHERDASGGEGVAALRQLYVAHVALVAPLYAVTAEAVLSSDPRAGLTADDGWRRARHAAQAAMYAVNVVLGYRQASVARALGLTKAGVCLAVRAVEDRRDDPGLDGYFDRLARLAEM